jgi:hypothetical protein
MADGDHDVRSGMHAERYTDKLAGLGPEDIDLVALAGALTKRLAAIVPAEFTVNVQDEAVYVLSDRRNGAASDLALSVTFGGSFAESVCAACERVLDCASDVIVEETTELWPARAGFPFGGAEIIDDAIRLWYGDRDQPYLELPAIPIDQVCRRSGSKDDSQLG